MVCRLLDERVENHPSDIEKFEDLITLVDDGSRQDSSIAIDADKIKRELGWKPKESIQTSLEKVVDWYLQNRQWCERLLEADR